MPSGWQWQLALLTSDAGGLAYDEPELLNIRKN